MKVAYIIGPYRAATAWEVEQNVRRAEEVALELWRGGFAVICPHTNTRFFNGAAPDSLWLRGCLELLSRCDFAVIIKGWQDSKGSLNEIKRTLELSMPCYEWDGIKNLVAHKMFKPEPTQIK